MDHGVQIRFRLVLLVPADKFVHLRANIIR